MRIRCARSMGMCFGVRDALWATQQVAHPGEVTIFGELVHNDEVNRRLHARGFSALAETGRDAMPRTPQVLITAHGVSEAARARFAAAGKQLIDTTCPLVNHLHQTALQLERSGYFVIIAGKRGHVEIEGIAGDLSAFVVVQSPEEVVPYPNERLAIVCQTTLRPSDADLIHQAVIASNPGKLVFFADTICRPTRQRQQALAELLESVDALIVVGGRHSNNTNQLVALAEQRAVPVLHIESESELDRAWCEQFDLIGLTAGTSTLESTIDEVYAGLVDMGAEPDGSLAELQFATGACQ